MFFISTIDNRMETTSSNRNRDASKPRAMHRTSVNSLTRILMAAGIAFALHPVSVLPDTGSLQSIESIRSAVSRFAQDGIHIPNARIETEVGNIDPRLRLAGCAKPLAAFLPAGSRLPGNSTIGVRCETPLPWTVYVSVRVKVMAPVWVAARALGRGETLRNTDLQSQIHDLAGIQGSAITDLAQALGRQAAVPIAPGTILRSNLLRASRLVKRGEKVTILAKSGGIEVRMSGEALSDGAEGDSIQVRNVLTKKTIQATVTQEGHVQVRL
jgi:flagella basal body P-ring formation protein FlgA